jgi:hypothetical protein
MPSNNPHMSHKLTEAADNGSMAFWDWKTGYQYQHLDTTSQPGSLDAEAGIMSSTFDRSGMRLICGEADKTSKFALSYQSLVQDANFASQNLEAGYVCDARNPPYRVEPVTRKPEILIDRRQGGQSEICNACISTSSRKASLISSSGIASRILQARFVLQSSR